MSNPNQHIEDFLKYYFKLPSPPQYAVLLKGKWGVGKTWFLKEIMASLHNPDYRVKTHLYVSLYGVASFEEIENDFFRQLHPVLSSKGMALAGKIGKGLLKTTLKIDLDGDGKSDASVATQIPDINLPDYLSNTEGLILVFDDLERASMDLENLLGYINYFVEHQGYKVIIIANEEELFHKEEKAEVSYKRIKEKLIGKTFEIQPRLESAISNFIKEVESGTTQELFNNNIELIKNYYRCSGYWNLRHLRQALMDFSRLIEVISVEFREKEGIIEQLLSTYLMFSFEIKSGEISPNDINKIGDLYITELAHKSGSMYSDTERDKVDSFYVKLREKYPTFDPFDMLIEKSVWIEILDKGIINKNKIEESLRNSKFFYNDNQPDWVRLWHFTRLEDKEFNKTLSSVYRSFENRVYKDVRIIKHITGIFLELSEESIIDKTKLEVLNIAKLNIDKLVEKGIKLPIGDSFYDDESSHGLGYYNRNDKEFKTLVSYISSLSKTQILDSLPPMGKELLEDITNNADNFSEKIFYTGSVSNYNQYPVLKYIEPIDFVNAILEISPDDRRQIILSVSSRYKSSGNIRNLVPEIVWLQKVVYLFLYDFKQKLSKIKYYQVKIFVNAYLVPAILNLNRVNSSPRKAENYMWSCYDKSKGYFRTTCFMT